MRLIGYKPFGAKHCPRIQSGDVLIHRIDQVTGGQLVQSLLMIHFVTATLWCYALNTRNNPRPIITVANTRI